MLFIKEAEHPSLSSKLAERTMDAHVEINVSPQVNNHFLKLIAEGGVPVLYFNHEGHADGIAISVISAYYRDLAATQPQVEPSLKGFAIPIAKSMATGDQSQELKQSYDLLKEAAHLKGLEEVPATRIKDGIYGIDRKEILAEMWPFVRRIRQGYGIALLPEGSVQGGRHPQGTSREEIYGMQEVKNNNLIGFFDLINKVVGPKGKKPFYFPGGLHGSFRIMEAPEDGKPFLTPLGKLSLAVGASIGVSLLRIQANMLMPYSEDEIIRDLGENWKEDPIAFNRYAMRKVSLGIPRIARGVYGIPADLEQVA